MLVSRQPDTEQNHWSMSKYETIFHKSTSSPRMSNSYDAPLSTQPDWQGQQYSFLPPGESTIFAQSTYDHVANSNGTSQSPAKPRSADTNPDAMDIEPKTESTPPLNSPLGHRRNSLDPLGLRRKQPSPIPEQQEPQGEYYSHKTSDSVKEESLNSADTPGLSMSLGSNPLSSVSSAGQGSDLPPSQSGNEDQLNKQDEDDEVIDDDDLIDGEGEGTGQPQTAAERTAARRKMKRFRLTHQQTRFLMSEFAKQPHPDAAHRERLSREIPGLSPRQVQVWFQNRRAKIKRLTADDRDRMIKMRAVPDDFDNVQALHSPYGAVHGLGTPMASPVDFSGSSYADHMMRGPLMVDVRRAEGDDHMSSTGLSPGFNGIGFNSSPSLSNPDILSPLSQSSTDRYGYSSHLSTPLSAGHRSTSNPFTRQNSMESSSLPVQSHHSSRHQVRTLQPLQLRETLTRSRSDNLQSPLRTSMSWKGDSIDYTTYQHGPSGSPQLSGRQQSVYQPDNATTMGGYESSTYAGSTVTSPTHMSYPNFSSSSFQNSQNRSRLRAASATLPLGLDLSGQRYSGSQTSIRSATSPTHRHAPTSHLGGGASSAYSSSFPTAPLTAPIEFTLPRTPGYRSSAHEYSMPQMSAPIAPSHDFSRAFQNMSTSSHTPMRDTFGGGPMAGSNDRNDDYDLKRKRSFTVPQGSSAPNSGHSYGTTT